MLLEIFILGELPVRRHDNSFKRMRVGPSSVQHEEPDELQAPSPHHVTSRNPASTGLQWLMTRLATPSVSKS